MKKRFLILISLILVFSIVQFVSAESIEENLDTKTISFIQQEGYTINEENIENKFDNEVSIQILQLSKEPQFKILESGETEEILETASLFIIKKSGDEKYFIANIKEEGGKQILKLYDETGGVEIDIDSKEIVALQGDEYDCSYWKCVGYYVLKQLKDPLTYAACASPCLIDPTGTLCLSCLVVKGVAGGVWDCFWDNCEWYSCKKNCAANNYYGEYETYCNGSEVWKHKYSYVFHCPDNVDYGEEGECEVDPTESFWRDSFKYKSCRDGCEEGECISQEPIIDLCIISSPLDNGGYNTRRILFDIQASGKLEKIEYIDYSDNRPRWKRLCSKCDEYSKTKSLNEGEHDILIRCVPYDGEPETHKITLANDYKDPRISKTSPKRNQYINGKNFYIKYTEENCKSLKLNINGDSFEGPCDSGRNIEKEFYQDLTNYNNQEITYYFILEDIAGNTDKSTPTKVIVDTTPPNITNPDSFCEKKGRYLYFDIEITEENLDEVTYSYLYRGKLREKRLCTKLDNGKCVKKQSFRGDCGDVVVKVVDEAGNSIVL